MNEEVKPNQIENQVQTPAIEDHPDKTKNRQKNTIKNYKVIYSIFFKYWITIIVIILAIIIFLKVIKKEIKLDINNEYDAQRDSLIQKYNEGENKIKDIEKNNSDIKIKIQQGILDISDDILLSYDNLISFKWYTIPRWTFLYEPESIENRDYFNDSDYDIEKLNKFMTNMVFVDYDEINTKKTSEPTFLQLENNNIEETFFLSCANRPRLFNTICDKYINIFLKWFFVYRINNDFPWVTKTLKNLITKEKYKETACKWLNNYIWYSNSAPSQLENIAILCWGDYLNNFYLTQDFIKTKSELENKYITASTSKYKEINEYKLVSYQQILYNNLEKGIPPYEWLYKNYTNYLISLLRKASENPIDSFYFDTTYRFNNIYIIPTLNKVKYQSTSNKREEIESIITDLEKINNWNTIDWYIWLKFVLTNNSLEEKINKIWSNFISTRDDIMSVLLKNIKSLSYIKVINDEIIWNDIKINWYLSINIKGTSTPVFFWSILENKNGNLIIKEISLNWYDELNTILWVIIDQKDYSIWEIYEYIQDNIWLYLSKDFDATPCDTIKEKLEKLKINWFELLYCDENRINMLKWTSWDKIFYQVKMDQYNINTIKSTNEDAQKYIDKNFVWIKTNSITVSNILSSILKYEPEIPINSGTLEWSNNAVVAIDDFKNFLWIVVTDIWERDGKAAVEFEVNNIKFIWIYDTNSKKLWPLFVEKEWVDRNEINFRKFSLYLTYENQNEINRFLIETVQYLQEIDSYLVKKYIINENQL